jgi:hypothetical protein
VLTVHAALSARQAPYQSSTNKRTRQDGNFDGEVLWDEGCGDEWVEAA